MFMFFLPTEPEVHESPAWYTGRKGMIDQYIARKCKFNWCIDGEDTVTGLQISAGVIYRAGIHLFWYVDE